MESTGASLRRTLRVGEKIELRIEKVAHGGHFIARIDGAVIFIRHGIPGERVIVEIESVGKSFSRGNVVQILELSKDRVTPPCAYAGICGGCDFQHIEIKAQRALKSDVISEQFSRIAKRELLIDGAPIVVEEIAEPLHWRTRTGVNISSKGEMGYYKSRSHDVVAISDCPALVPELEFAEKARKKYSPGTRIDLAVPNYRVGNHTFQVSPDSFWQSHKDAPRVLTEAVISYADLRDGDYVLDLYGGVGLFTAAIGDYLGTTGHIELIEGSKSATADAKVNFAHDPRVEIRTGDVGKILPRISKADVIVLDPPREGAGREVISEIGRLRARRVIYVACDPAALARDVTYLEEAGYRMVTMRAFDLFPMTHHIECVALFEYSEVS